MIKSKTVYIGIKTRNRSEMHELMTYLKSIGYAANPQWATVYPTYLCLGMIKNVDSTGKCISAAFCSRTTMEGALASIMSLLSGNQAAIYPSLRHFYTSNHNVNAKGESMVGLFV